MLQPTHQPNGQIHHSGLLPRTIDNRDDFVGVAIILQNQQYLSVRFSVSKALLKKIGKPDRVGIRGTPENGYLIGLGKDIKPISIGTGRTYICIATDKVSAPHGERRTVWMRAEIDDKRIRIPPLPPAWISGDPEFVAGAICEETEREMSIGKPGDDAVRISSTSAPIAPPVALTVPPAKVSVDYRLPDGMGVAEAQALLARKLEEARAIMKELERRTGLRMTLTRNFQIVLDVSGK